MSPILVRPVREQLEHDRVIRLLQQDLQKRKVEVGINPGSEQNASVGSGVRKEYPDAVVYSLEKGKKLVAVVEVETGESVNHLEAMAQWAHLAKLRVPFHLYVPINSVDVARRLSHDYKISVTEIWSYHQVGEQFKFTLIHPATGTRGSKGATPPRTVSVATIRVALPSEPEPPSAEEPVAKPEPTPSAKVGAKTPGIKTIPARVVPVKVAPKAAPAPAPAVVKAGAKPALDKAAPSTVKSVSAPPVAKGPTAPKAAAKAVPVSTPVKTAPVKAASVKPPAGKAAPTKAAKPVSKSVATARPVAKAAGRAVPPKAKPSAKTAAVRTVKATKAVARNATRPVAKRK